MNTPRPRRAAVDQPAAVDSGAPARPQRAAAPLSPTSPESPPGTAPVPALPAVVSPPPASRAASAESPSDPPGLAAARPDKPVEGRRPPEVDDHVREQETAATTAWRVGTGDRSTAASTTRNPDQTRAATAKESIEAPGLPETSQPVGLAEAPRPVAVIPSRQDGFVRLLSRGIGGPLGRRAATSRLWWNPVRIMLAVATLTYLLGMIFRIPCRITVAGQAPDHFRLMCYSDIGLLYSGRGLMAGLTPYLDSDPAFRTLEYPVLTGWFLEFERLLTVALGGASGTDLTAQQQVASTLLFVDINQLLLGLLFLVAVWAQVRTVEGRPWDAMMLAASPAVAAAAQINWDLLVVALTALGCLLWARRNPLAAGVLLGLAAAAKLYPVLLLGPLILLCLRTRKLNALALTLGGFVLGWAVPNLPVLLLAPGAWLSFWTFNYSVRQGDLGSVWYVLSLAGIDVPGLNVINALLMIVACAAIGLLILGAPRRPRLGQVIFLVVAVFLITNKVYSPQYVLWLLPLLILARPRWRDWLFFTAAELAYFAAIWWHLAGVLRPPDGSPDRLYWVAVIFRVGVQLYLVVQVVIDIVRPGRDVVRAGGVDDPIGGVLDGAPDRGWVISGRRSRLPAHA